MDQCTWTIVILRERFLFLTCIKDYQSSIAALNTNEGITLSPQTYIEHGTMKATTPPNPLYTEPKDKDPNSAVQFGTMLDCKREEQGMQKLKRKLGVDQLRFMVETVTSTTAAFVLLLPEMMHRKLRLNKELAAEAGLDELPQIREVGEEAKVRHLEREYLL
jgi:hypothetical protein